MSWETQLITVAGGIGMGALFASASYARTHTIEDFKPVKFFTALIWGLLGGGIAAFYGYDFPFAQILAADWINKAVIIGSMLFPWLGGVFSVDFLAKLIVREIDARLSPEKEHWLWVIIVKVLGNRDLPIPIPPGAGGLPPPPDAGNGG